jgi:hypothetical protein
MEMRAETTWTAFEGPRRLATGPAAEVASRVKEAWERGQGAPVLVFDDETGEQVDFDVRATAEDIARRYAPPVEAPRGPGRPRLGVVAREVTLLPRHWEWLNGQPGGASVALRKLVEEARRANAGKDRARRSQEAAYRFMTAMAGNRAGFEEALRALFAGDRAHFDRETEGWPVDVREHAHRLAAHAFSDASG